MTSAEVMKEITKMPLAEKRRVLAALAEQLGQTAGQTDLDSKEERFRRMGKDYHGRCYRSTTRDRQKFGRAA